MLGRAVTASRPNPTAPLWMSRTTPEIDFPDPSELVRRLDVPRRLDAGRELAVEVLGRAMERTPAARRRERRRRAIVAATVGLVVAGIATWAVRRIADRQALRAETRRFDRESAERAAGEGMGTAIGSPTSSDALVPVDMAVPDDATRVEDRTDRMPSEDVAVRQVEVGIGVVPRV